METKAITTKEIIAILAEKFPACFSIQGQAKPLKVGIFQELAEQLNDDEQISKTRLRQALRHYTSSWRYLKSIKLGAFRVDLAGNDVAEIDQEQADHAAKTLQESQDKYGQKAKPKKAPVNQDKTAKKPKQFKHVKAPKAGNKNAKKAPAAEVKLTPVDESTVKIGAKVKVKFGNAPMDAVVTEIAGSDVQVQLTSGMVVKTQIENVFS